MFKISLDKILSDITKVKIGIIGDFCLDVYWHANDEKSEISIETNLMTRAIEVQKYSLGGAGNIAANLHAMGVRHIEVFGVTGDDPFSYKMKAVMAETGIDSSGILTQKDNWSTHVYIKPVRNKQEENRIDFGNFNELSDETAGILLKFLESKISSLDFLIINQQIINGIHNSEKLRNGLQQIIDSNPDKKIIIDSRHLGDKYKHLMYKMNGYEASILCGYKYKHDDLIPADVVRKSGLELHRKFSKPVFITRGDRGCMVFDKGSCIDIPGLLITGRIDTVGAGDSMLSGISACMAAGYKPDDAAVFGGLVSGVTIQKLFTTGTASPEEITSLWKNSDYVYNVEKADDIRTAVYADSSEIEIVNPLPEGFKLTHIIFDHDGTISTLREGWENIMAPMMIKAVLGDNYLSASETDYSRVVKRVHKFIDETTGIQTIIQMQGLVEMVREFGFVPPEKILDEVGYKKIYNDELILMVNVRLEKLKKKELSVEDFTLKNAVRFLEYLNSKKVTLYLASGTDEDDVKKEAEALGYAGLFGGRIYGSVGNVKQDAKKMVIERILNDIGRGKAKSVAAIGDGPVEVREIRKAGGIAVGIASDELRRFSLNISKRTRLIKAGADIIIPDYSQFDTLLKVLNLK